MDEGWNNHANLARSRNRFPNRIYDPVSLLYIFMELRFRYYAIMFHRMIIPCCDMSSDCGVSLDYCSLVNCNW